MVLHRAVLQIGMDDKRARTLVESLMPERGEDMVFSVSKSDEGVVLSFEASDLSELRAAINSYMRLALVALSVTDQGR